LRNGQVNIGGESPPFLFYNVPCANFVTKR
jgi:hypothetical protein